MLIKDIQLFYNEVVYVSVAITAVQMSKQKKKKNNISSSKYIYISGKLFEKIKMVLHKN